MTMDTRRTGCFCVVWYDGMITVTLSTLLGRMVQISGEWDASTCLDPPILQECLHGMFTAEGDYGIIGSVHGVSHEALHHMRPFHMYLIGEDG